MVAIFHPIEGPSEAIWTPPNHIVGDLLLGDRPFSLPGVIAVTPVTTPPSAGVGVGARADGEDSSDEAFSSPLEDLSEEEPSSLAMAAGGVLLSSATAHAARQF